MEFRLWVIWGNLVLWANMQGLRKGRIRSALAAAALCSSHGRVFSNVEHRSKYLYGLQEFSGVPPVDYVGI